MRSRKETLSNAEVLELIGLLEKCYPEAVCALGYNKDYELLFAARLSAQCTDARVNMVTPELFARYPTLRALAEAEASELESIIHPCGLFRTKARDIIAASAILIGEFDCRVPDNMEDLLKLPGVGRKTANLMMGDIHGKPAVVVDTHCIRLCGRIGLTDAKNPVKIETELRRILPPEKSSDFCHRLVLHGRAVCTAKNPACMDCIIAGLCKSGNHDKIPSSPN